MTASLRWTSAELERLPDNGKRYEIIDDQLHVSVHPHCHHQHVCGQIGRRLSAWSE